MDSRQALCAADACEVVGAGGTCNAGADSFAAGACAHVARLGKSPHRRLATTVRPMSLVTPDGRTRLQSESGYRSSPELSFEQTR